MDTETVTATNTTGTVTDVVTGTSTTGTLPNGSYTIHAPVLDADKDQSIGTDGNELEKVRADYARLKAALDKATKEAGDAKKALRAKQTAEEIAAEELKARDEATQKELEDLRREVATTKATKSVMSELGADEETAGKIAGFLYGAEDRDKALGEIKKLWTAREKALRLEYGKIPAPGVGGSNGEETESEKAIKLAKELGRERAASGKPLSETLGSYIR